MLGVQSLLRHSGICTSRSITNRKCVDELQWCHLAAETSNDTIAGVKTPLGLSLYHPPILSSAHTMGPGDSCTRKRYDLGFIRTGYVKTWAINCKNKCDVTILESWVDVEGQRLNTYTFSSLSARRQLLICLFLSLVTKSCLTVCDPVDCRPPGFSVLGVLQARILEWVAISFSRSSSQPRDWNCISCLAGEFLSTEPPRKSINPLKGYKEVIQTSPPEESRRHACPCKHGQWCKRRDTSVTALQTKGWKQALGVTLTLI